MRIDRPLSLLLTASIFLSACEKGSTSSSSSDDGNWIRRSDFEGVARSEAVTFTIGDTAYIATGYDGDKRLKDLWEYDPVANFWLQKAEFPGTARSSAVGFAVGQKGYIGTGYDGVDKLKDFWEYDQASNTWTQRTDFGGSARYDAVAFAVAGKGYISTGFDGNYLKDFWEFDPATNQWTQRVSLGGTKRSGAVAFAYKDKGYIVTGINNGTNVNDFWMFDPATDTWTEKNKISNVSTETFDDSYAIVRNNATAFIVGNKAYITTGENGAVLGDTWEYNFDTDLWDKKTNFEGSTRTGAASFSVKDRGFVLTGRSSSFSFDDLREFLPSETYNAND